MNYAGNEQAANEVAERIAELGRECVLIKANVGDSAEVEDMIKTVLDRFGKIDVLVNNAGITRDNLLMRMKEEEFDQVIQTNLKGVYNCVKAVTRPMMKQRSGRIITISSVVGSIGNPGQVNYVAAKAGVVGMTKAVAKELAPRGITVNAVSPGFITTDMTDKLSEDQKQAILKQVPLGTFGQPEHIARTVKFLASDDAAYITGQNIHVDGGMYMSS